MLLSQRLDERERLLQLSRIALERLELLALRLQHAKELLDLDLLSECDAPELLDISLASQIHTSFRSHRAIESKCFRLDDAGR